MEFFHLLNAQSYDELVGLIERSDTPFHVRQHVIRLLDDGIESRSEADIDIVLDEVETFLNNHVSKLCVALVEAKGRKRNTQDAVAEFKTSLNNSDLAKGYLSESIDKFTDDLMENLK